jgi:hypothetical protein
MIATSYLATRFSLPILEPGALAAEASVGIRLAARTAVSRELAVSRKDSYGESSSFA